MDTSDILELHTKYPFLTGLRYAPKADSPSKDVVEYVGIVHNSSKQTTSFYNMQLLEKQEDIKAFLAAGDKWWRESNRLIPIAFFLSREVMEPFRPILTHLGSKNVSVICGELSSLDNVQRKRSKRKTFKVVVEE